VSAAEGFWRAPRRLADLLEAGALTPTQYALLNYVGQRDGDRRAVVTTQDTLAALLRVDKKTIARALDRLATLGLLEDDRVAGRVTFRVWLGQAAIVVEGPTSDTPRTHLGHTSDTPRTFNPPPMSEVTSDTPSDTASAPSGPNAAPVNASSGDATSDTSSDSRARAETETETETETERGASLAAERRQDLAAPAAPTQERGAADNVISTAVVLAALAPHFPEPTNDSERGALRKASKDIAESLNAEGVNPDDVAAQIGARAEAWFGLLGWDHTMTANGLAVNWSTIGREIAEAVWWKPTPTPMLTTGARGADWDDDAF
jgi:hypothetical protein